jgi:hypothetical protein
MVMKEQPMTENKFSGQCKGGPKDGEFITHWCNEYWIYKPMRDAFNNKAPIETVPLGHYYYEPSAQAWWWKRS